MTDYVISEEQIGDVLENAYDLKIMHDIIEKVMLYPVSDVIKQYDKDTIAELERRKSVIIDRIKRDPRNEMFVKEQEVKWRLIIEEIALIRDGVIKT